MKRAARCWIAGVLSVGLGLGCTASEPDASGTEGETEAETGAPSSSSSSTTEGTTSAPTTTTTPGSSTTDPGTTAGETTEADASTTTGGDGLPDYANSKCWGDPSSTLVYNGKTHETGTIAATCRAEGERTLLYVQDELWDAGVTQDDVNAFMHRFEIFTPEGSHNPAQGVITNNEEIFGALDMSGFPGGKLAIFVVDSGGGGDGYLCGWCDYPQLHLDGVILQPLDGDFPVSIAAHESYHVIHRAVDADETMWVDESLAEAAMTANGFFTDTDWLSDFLADPDQNWGPGAPELGGLNYGAALLWGTYLWEYGGPPLMEAITHEAADDWAGLDVALGSLGEDVSAYQLYLNMLVSVYLDAPELGYGFESFDFEDVSREGDLFPGMMRSGGLNEYGVDYYRINETGELTASLTSADPDVVALAVVAGREVVVTGIDTDTPISVAQGDIAFALVTGRGAATYDVLVQ